MMQRITHLDNLRTFCMILGVFVHANHLAVHANQELAFGAAAWIPIVSRAFRMETFFIISGFLGAMLLERQGASRFLSGRLRNLAIPLAASLLLLNPVTLWLSFRYSNGVAYPDGRWADVWAAVAGRIPADGTLLWHLHLWFLIALIAYVLAAPLVLPVLRWISERDLAGRLVAFRDGLFVPMFLALVVGAWGLLARGVEHFALGEVLPMSWHFVPTAVVDWGYYLLGMLFFLSPRIRSAAFRIDVPLLILIVVLVLIQRLGWSGPGVVSEVLRSATALLLRTWVCFTVLFLSERLLGRTSTFTAVLNRTIYTNYLFHFLFLYAGATIYAAFLPIDLVAFFAISIATIALGCLFHLWVVERSPLLKLLFNGRWTARPRVSSQTRLAAVEA